MSSKIVAAVPYKRGHSESRSKSKSDKRPSGITAASGFDSNLHKPISVSHTNQSQTIGISANKALIGSLAVNQSGITSLGGPSTSTGIGSNRPLGIASLSSHNLVSNKPGDF